MASLAKKVETRSAADGAVVPTIMSLNDDVFTLIVQKVVDEEADLNLAAFITLPREPIAAKTIALVCKKWKDITYSTPSIWSVINLDMNSSVSRMQTKLDSLANRAKSAPVDLYILNIHLHEETHGLERGHDDCCCKPGSTGLRLDFTRLLNVRRLWIHYTQCNALSLLEASLFAFLNHVKLVEFGTSGGADLNRGLDLQNFLRYASGIVHLRLNWVGPHQIPWALTNSVLMPHLRTLRIATGGNKSADNLPLLTRILSHTPNIEELTLVLFEYHGEVPIRVPIPAQYLERVKCLPKLWRISTDGFTPVNWLFTDSGVGIPNLREIDYDDGNLKGGDNDVKKFFSAHKSIKSIRLWARSFSSYDKRLFWAPNIEELTIRTGRYSLGLTPLYKPKIEEITETSHYICPSLRVIMITDIGEDLLPSSFEGFVRVRCLPVNKDGHTAAGCKAVEVLKLEMSNYSTRAYTYLSATEAWKKARVLKVCNNRYELRWSYHSDQVA